jgi:imidazole glycerol-phosphate synthase subunit HisF
MKRTRVIPVLLVNNGGLYKTQKFKNPKYVGDPINAIKIFNDKEVDELCVLDITASTQKREPNFKLIEEFASECFMPVCYGGGISKIEHAKKIFSLGIEKISLNFSAFKNQKLITEIATIYGSQAVVVSIDYKKNLFGKTYAYTLQGNESTKKTIIEYAKELESNGAGEILLNNIDRDGTFSGYDLEFIKLVASSVKIPVIACGGASKIEDFKEAVTKAGASAVAAGSMFVFHGVHRAVLISYPTQTELKEKLYTFL